MPQGGMQGMQDPMETFGDARDGWLLNNLVQKIY